MKIVKFQINVISLKSWKGEKEEKVDKPILNVEKLKLNIYYIESFLLETLCQ